MTGSELLELFERGKKRCCLIGTEENGVIAGLDLEGRLYTTCAGKVMNRVNPDAILHVSEDGSYLNPGGDGLWPAPEGTCLGYEYASGTWRVPPGLVGARFTLTSKEDGKATIEADVDLINSVGLGIPTLFRREITVSSEEKNTTSVTVLETIKYLGSKTLTSKECLLAPWTLCQFDCGPRCEVVFPEVEDSQIWDLYSPSTEKRFRERELWHTMTDCSSRYQIGIGPEVPWIEAVLPDQKLKVRRSTKPLAAGTSYIDIADAPPENSPQERETRYSVYSDTSGFMEIEAAGGCPEEFHTGCEMSVEVATEYRLD